MSPLVCKYVFYGPEHNAKEGPHENWILKVLKCKNGINHWTELKEQIKKKWVICVVVMFPPRVIAIKVSKMAAKKSVTASGKCLNAPETFYWVLSKMVWLIDFGVKVREILRVEISKNC